MSKKKDKNAAFAARRKYLCEHPELIEKIAKGPIATAKGLLHAIPPERDNEIDISCMWGTAIEHLKRAKSELAGVRSPQLKEIKELLKICKTRQKVPAYFSQQAIDLKLNSPAEDFLKNCRHFLHKIKTSNPKNNPVERHEMLTLTQRLIDTFHELFTIAPTQDDLVAIQHNLMAAKLMLITPAGNA